MSPNRATLLLANVSRRHVLKGLAASGALVLAARWNLSLAQEEAAKYGADAMPNGWVDDPDVFIRLDTDGTVTVVNHRSEMGQGIRTSLVMVVADELGADWERVRVEQAIADEEKYGNQNTDGSRSMRHWFDPMRRAAAAARTLLEHAAAGQWEVPVEECRAGVHVVVHRPSGRELGFGELASEASELPVREQGWGELASDENQPAASETETLRLKPRGEWRYIGRDSGPSQQARGTDVVRPLAIDGEAIVNGSAVYGADVRMDGMLYAVVARPPVYGATLARVDDSGARKVPGVLRTVEIKGTGQPAGYQPLGGVAVVAENTWAAIEGRKGLDLAWNEGPAGDNAAYDTEAYRERLEKAATSPGQVVRTRGDVEAGLANAATRVEATYYMPHLAHATMEPPAALARFADGKIEIWAPVQDPQTTRQQIAERLGLDMGNVTVNVTLLGGGFGRKSKPDFVLEAASLAREFEGRPVRVQWTREDDLHHDYFHAVSVDRLDAGLDEAGKTVAWRHRTLSPSIGSLFGPDPEHKQSFELGMGFTTLPFDIPALRLENPEASAHVRTGWFRAVYNLPHAFAIQSFAAELAAAAGRDHRDYLLELLGPARQIDPREVGDTWNYGENPELYPIDVGRLRAVLETATEAADWDRKRPEGRGVGLAVHHSFVSYAAVVFDVEVGSSGELVIHSADVAFDCGPQINPDRIRAQMEGACIMGIGIALHSEITARDGRIQQDNFHQFLIPRMSDAPRTTRVHLVNGSRDVPLGGAGEPGLPPVAPALCNAIFAATGKRIRRLPIRDQLAS